MRSKEVERARIENLRELYFLDGPGDGAEQHHGPMSPTSPPGFHGYGPGPGDWKNIGPGIRTADTSHAGIPLRVAPVTAGRMVRRAYRIDDF